MVRLHTVIVGESRHCTQVLKPDPGRAMYPSNLATGLAGAPERRVHDNAQSTPLSFKCFHSISLTPNSSSNTSRVCSPTSGGALS